VVWNSSGWTFLGDRVVQGRKDHDKIHVGKRNGKWTAITLVVEGSDLEMFDVVVIFGNGDKFSPDTRAMFREGSRTRAIDLPGEARAIKSVAFRYGNLPGGGRAKVALFAREAPAAAPPPAPVPPQPPAPTPAPAPGPGFDLTGWTFLGDRWVRGNKDHDAIHVGKKEGRFKRIVILVDQSDLEMFDIVVQFGNGEKFSPDVRQVFKEGSRSRVIDLPGGDRFIQKITFRYGNLPGGGRARVHVYAKD
jgi:hypothetical protein